MARAAIAGHAKSVQPKVVDIPRRNAFIRDLHLRAREGCRAAASRHLTPFRSRARQCRRRGRSSVGRASRSQCEGQGFESPRLHQGHLCSCAGRVRYHISFCGLPHSGLPSACVDGGSASSQATLPQTQRGIIPIAVARVRPGRRSVLPNRGARPVPHRMPLVSAISSASSRRLVISGIHEVSICRGTTWLAASDLGDRSILSIRLAYAFPGIVRSEFACSLQQPSKFFAFSVHGRGSPSWFAKPPFCP